MFHNRLKLEYLKQYRAHLAAGGAPSDDSVWNQWLQALGARLAGHHKAVVWNQPIWVGKHEACWPGVFSPYRLVVVHRDPQDQFAEVVRQGKIGKRKSDPAFDDSEQDDIAYVLKGIAAKLEHLKALEQTLPMGHLLTVNFETFVKTTPVRRSASPGTWAWKIVRAMTPLRPQPVHQKHRHWPGRKDPVHA